MKISIHKIPANGLPVNFTLTPGYLCQDCLEEDPVHQFIRQPVACRGLLTRLNAEDVELDLKVNGLFNPSCDRCLNEYQLNIELPIKMIFIPLKGGKNDKALESVNSGLYQGDQLDLGQIVREQIFLNLPIKFICQEDCRGLEISERLDPLASNSWGQEVKEK